jgi:hypothetical protein
MSEKRKGKLKNSLSLSGTFFHLKILRESLSIAASIVRAVGEVEQRETLQLRLLGLSTPEKLHFFSSFFLDAANNFYSIAMFK